MYRIINAGIIVKGEYDTAQEADSAMGEGDTLQFICESCGEWFSIFFIPHRRTCANCKVKVAYNVS